ncbi:MAG: ABC transporter substrate-binding protein [Candidatus Hermodarchaeota archaeon]
MNFRNKVFLIPVLIFLVVLVAPLTSTVQLAAAQDDTLPSREEIVWSTGYWQGPTGWNPFFWEEAWGTFFMYENLFDYNYETDELMGILGKNMVWKEDGKKIEIALRPEAKWSDDTQVTADDVIYTYDHLLSLRFGGFADRVESMTKLNDSGLEVTLKDEAKYSRVIWEGFMGYNKIGPKHIWEEIVAYQKTNVGDWGGWELQEFKNNWFDPTFNEDWKVCSGMYEPYYLSDTLDKHLYVRRDDWWGNDILGAPKPKYIGQLHYATNFAVNQAFRAGESDYYGGYYPRVWELLAENPYIHLWTDNPPYFLPVSGIVELVPNHFRFPFNQLWLRQALAYAINYDDMSEVAASGYLEKARAGYLSNVSAVQKDLYDPAVEAAYAIDFDPAKAVEILEENCFKHTDGAWYTNDVPAQYQGMLGHNNESISDELPTEPGYNVKLGDWDIDVVYGWSDSMMQTTLLSTYFADIGITTTPNFVEYGAYVTNFQAMDFDIENFVMGFSCMATPQAGFTLFQGTAGQWTNFTAWYNPTYVEKFEAFETSAPGSAEEQQLASDLQEEIASKLPAIPISPNGYWYGFNTRYWTGWPNENDPWIQVTAPWATGNAGVMQAIIRNLEPGAEIPTPGFGFIPVFAAIIAAVLILFLSKKQKK